jgi:hypothetical protein
MYRFSYRKSEIMKCEKGIRRKSGNEKPGVMSKIVKNIKNINRRDCGDFSKCVRRQNFKNSYGSKPVLMFRDISFILLNLILLNLILFGVPYSHILSYSLY